MTTDSTTQDNHISTPALIVGFLILLAVLVGIAHAADAHHTGVEDEGAAVLRVDNGLTQDTRLFFLDCELDGANDASCATYDPSPGARVTVEYVEDTIGDLPPESPDTVILSVVIDDEDDATDTLITLHNGATPASGDQFSFWWTDDGTPTGDPRTGTLRLRLQAIFNGAIGSDYDCSSDGDETSGANRDCFGAQAGWLQGATDVTSFTASSPPGGTLYAYGTAFDEDVTGTIGLDPAPFKLHNYQFIRIDAVRATDGSTVETGGLQVRSDSATETDVFTIDNTFDASESDYGFQVVLSGNSPLSGDIWARIDDAITAGTRISDTTARDADLFTADPRITFSDDGTTENNQANTDHALYNRGEDVSYDFWLLNARNEQLTRSMTIEARSTTGSTVDSRSITGGNYGATYTIAASDPAAANFQGLGYTFRAIGPDQQQDADDPQFLISSRYRVDAHTQASSTLVKDDWPNENATEDVQFVSGEDLIRLWCHIRNARLDENIDTNANTVDKEVRDDAGDLQGSSSHQTQADGWTQNQLEVAAVPPLGQWTATCSVDFDGNTGTRTQQIAVGSAFTGDKAWRIFARSISGDAQTQRIYALGEIATSPAAPDSVPIINITAIDHSVDPERAISIIDAAPMHNANNDTQTINGTLYYFEWSPDFDAGQTFDGSNAVIVNIEVSGILNGTFVQHYTPAEIRMNDVDDSGMLSTFTAGFVGLDDAASFTLIFWIIALALALEHHILLGIPAALLGILDGLITGWPAPTSFAILVYAAGLVLHWWLAPHVDDTDEMRHSEPSK